ncbi:hypothetical protein VTU32_00975 [Thermoanaerobacter sp. CM-CNRG TB177]|uniref:Integrase SAM-like N-terminal domain-containing protein n=1 Tax=Thermoanaerobacter pseudethanolicus (strain ATCC 33223 / 39E) TaxID=340099 RepID=B0KBM2_THEP3|nr:MULTISPECIES: hypothetical protein [Thermoanaerobacter]ABY95317.1 hypothetical protein Teth39_1680 [Thermoanaerobacter pseudethanolicus ATCC 33223]KUJ90286.1 MAG: hypothetical protein XD37_1509 [Thermoanaerobacter thermocopriae]MDN5332609.1 hypothetical protein [Tepidanaerobacteraceae bacterium]
MGSIKKRGNKYQVIIELEKDINEKRIRRYFTANSEAEAKKILTEQEYQLQQNCFVIPTEVTFGEFLNYWFDNYVKIKNEKNNTNCIQTYIRQIHYPQVGQYTICKG